MEDPQLQQPRAVVTTQFPGASAERVESLVTEKIEQVLLTVEDIETVESTSRPGTSVILLERKDQVKDVDEAWSRIREKLTEVTPQLPPRASDPIYTAWEGKAYAMILALNWTANKPPNYATLGRMAEALETELRTLDGIEKVDLFGQPAEEILVEVNPTEAAALGLTPQVISQQIQQSDAKVAAGLIQSPANQFLFEVDTSLASVERIRSLPIQFNNVGQFVRLDDIATVTKGIRQPPAGLANVKGLSAIALGVHMESGERIDQWSKAIYQTLGDFKKQLPDSLSASILMDQSRYVAYRINNLMSNLILGTLCVIAVTIPMMGWRASLVVGSSLPLAILMVFGGMKVLNIPLHQMSVTGLVIALGLLIDNAIVVVDEVQHRFEAGLPPMQALSESIQYLKVPLLASTLTTVFTFLPIALAPGRLGEFVSAIGVSVILALLSSLLLSLTIIPALSGRLHQRASKNSNNHPRRHAFSWLTRRQWWQQGLCFPLLTNSYTRLLSKILARPTLGILLALILPITGFLAVTSLEEQFFPPAARDQIYIEFELQPQTALEETRLATQQARDIIRQHPAVKDVHWFIGENAPSFYYNLQQGRKNAPNYAQGLVDLASTEDISQVIQTFQKELDSLFPAAQILVRQLEQGPPFAAPIELRIYGPNLSQLKALGTQVRGELAQVVHITHARTSLMEAVPEMKITLNEEQVQLAGLSNTGIAQQLDSYLEGSIGGSLIEATEELPVRVRLADGDRASLEKIASLDLLPEPRNGTAGDSNAATSIPLTALADIQMVPELATIARRKGKRVNIVQGFVDAGVLPAIPLKAFRKRLDAINFQLPPGYSLEFGGEEEQRSQARSNLESTLSVLLVMMVATLVLSLNSFRLAGIIAFVGICSVGLGLFSLWLFGFPLGFMAILGTIGLIGVAINDSIVVLVALESNSLAKKGDVKAIRQVILQSTRHVLSTTITTISGFIPLLIDGGDFWPPLAICVAGGVGGATILALICVPCIYLLLAGRRQRLPLSVSNSPHHLDPIT